MSDRAVSDVVGFVLVFSLVVITVGVVFVSGFGGLERAQQAERIDNGERAFDVLADNTEDIYRRGVPNRKTEIKLAQSQLTLRKPTRLNVTIEGVTDGSGNRIVYDADTRPLVFSSASETEIVYEAGAVIRTDRRGARMLNEPPMLITEERTVLQYVVLTSPDGNVQSLGGESTVLVRGSRTGRSALVSATDSEVTFEINTTTQRAPVWEQYIDERADWDGGDPCGTVDTNAGDGRKTVACTFEPDSVYVSSTGIETKLEP